MSTDSHHRQFHAVTLAALLLAGCGGDSADNAATPPVPGPVSGTVSGTVAAGVPMAGTVTIKDGLGTTRIVTIGDNGSYSVDAAGLSGPLMLRAEGEIGADRRVLHSAVAPLAGNATVNITPLTDLIVANAVGQTAGRHFDKGNFVSIVAADLQAESDGLKARLLPVLEAMKVDPSIDLMSTPFTPGSSALDLALDVIRIDIDAPTARATITNLVNRSTIDDDLTVKAGAENPASILAATGMTTAAADITAIRAALNDFAALFKTAVPAANVVVGQLSPGFLHDGRGSAEYAKALPGARDWVGGSVRDIIVTHLDYAAAGGPVATLGLAIVAKTGDVIDRAEGWQMIKNADGVWRWRGNQALIDFAGGAQATRRVDGCLATGYEFDLRFKAGSVPEEVIQMNVSGPGLPSRGITYWRGYGTDRSVLDRGANYDQADSPNMFVLATMNCAGAARTGDEDATIAALPDQGLYTLTAYAYYQEVVPLGPTGTIRKRIAKRPLTLAETQAAPFPSFSTSAPLQTYAGGTLTISGLSVTPDRPLRVYLSLQSWIDPIVSAQADLTPAADGRFSASLSLPKPNYAPRLRDVRVSTRDAYGRTLLSFDKYFE